MTDNNKNIIIATGGTGGHIFPAVSLSNYLNKTGFISTLTTDERGLKFIDKKFLNNTVVINSSRIDKKRKIFSISKMLIAILRSLVFLLKKKPKFIFGMGGYASFPLCFAGLILRIPFIIYENNLLAGKANRYLAPFAKKIFVSYKDIEGINKRFENKIVVIGNILREDIFTRSKMESAKFKNNFNILILGGSQAAKVFAEILPDIFIECKKNNINFKIYQQCLDNQKFYLKEKYESNNINYELFSFTFDILKYYDWSNLAITRAGSSALGELLNRNIPIISIPLASSSENHQYKNAKYFMEKGFGIMVEEKEIKFKLFNLLESIHKDKSMLSLIKKNQENHSDKNVFINIKKEITKLFYEN